MTNGYVTKSVATAEDLQKIHSFSRRELSEDELYVFDVTLCNNDIDRDFERFSVKALNEMAPMFVGKTGIFDHSMRSADQKARIFETRVEKEPGRKTLDNKELYSLKARAYMLNNEENRALIDEIDAGIKKEVSVSCSLASSVCSICSADKKICRCEHIPGKTYGDKLCFCTLDDAQDAYEFSFVAVPAQREAGVTKSFDIKEDDIMTDVVKQIGEGREITLTKAQSNELYSYIEELKQDAQLAQSYKKELAKQVVELFKQAFPKMDAKLFDSVASVMTVNELLGFCNGMKASNKAKQASPQLVEKTGAKKINYSEFQI